MEIIIVTGQRNGNLYLAGNYEHVKYFSEQSTLHPYKLSEKILKLCETYSPIISKSLFSKLNKCGAVYTNEMLKKKAFERYHINSCTFWAFDMKKLEEFLK